MTGGRAEIRLRLVAGDKSDDGRWPGRRPATVGGRAEVQQRSVAYANYAEFLHSLQQLEFFIYLFLTILGYFPGIIYAVYVIISADPDRYRHDYW
ncbi:hypothetical protein IEQ34_005973 [Dendrobium chrysotoxum]|uniref:Uncharacterized protein n=1 Tax=Dendrobium chrysotoxum TaxID=161865 RepID=A0AAV7GVI1_DENCH|nr:hypothetical protein IEQ34_005973 [Dendrobium chrysotoxum]